MIYQVRKYIFLCLIMLFGKQSLNAQIQVKAEKTSAVTYSVVSIPYAACTCSVGTKILPGYDDKWQNVIKTGFSFNYFGKIYDSCTVGANGQITFIDSLATGYDAWNISAALPNTSNMPANTICASFRDIDPTSSGDMYYSTYGTSPNRYFVISWCKVPLFSTQCYTANPRSTFQLILHETTNCIDVFIENSTSCPLWNSGYGIIGIQDSAGTTGYSPPGRNYPSTWTASYEGWRFMPSGSPCSSTTSGPCAISTSINNFGSSNSIMIYPNPTQGKFFVKIIDSSDLLIEIDDLIGTNVMRQMLTSDISEIDTKNFESGIYYIKILDKNRQNIYRVKLIKE